MNEHLLDYVNRINPVISREELYYGALCETSKQQVL
jgi:hypothetical protein